MPKRRYTFVKSGGEYAVREFVDGNLELAQRMSFERAFRRMSQLEREGFRLNNSKSDNRKYVYDRET